jgi:hypothetical protein
MKQNLRSSVGRCCVVTLLFLATFSNSYSQYSESSSVWEAGITVGPSNFLGDLGGRLGKGTTFLKDNNIPLTKLMFGAFLGYQPNDWLAFRLSASYGSLEGDDAIIKGKGGLEEARKIRNSNFRSKLLEGTFMLEIYPTVFFEYEPAEIFHKIRPYGVIGVGAFHFNPQGTDPLNGQWVNLKDLHTEGQGFAEFPDRKEYKLTQMNIPMGFGAKYFLSEQVNLSLEVIHRKTFTDYIDDVSTTYIDPALFQSYLPLGQSQLAERMANKTGDQLGNNTRFFPGDKRGTATNNDAYYSVQFKLGVRLGNSSDRRWRNSTSCPIRF